MPVLEQECTTHMLTALLSYANFVAGSVATTRDNLRRTVQVFESGKPSKY